MHVPYVKILLYVYMYVCTYVCTYIGMKCIHSIIQSGYLTICFFSIFFFLVLMEELNLLLFASEIKIVKRDLNLMAISISISQKSCIACEEMNDDGLMVYCVTLLLTYIYILHHHINYYSLLRVYYSYTSLVLYMYIKKCIEISFQYTLDSKFLLYICMYVFEPGLVLLITNNFNEKQKRTKNISYPLGYNITLVRIIIILKIITR